MKFANRWAGPVLALCAAVGGAVGVTALSGCDAAAKSTSAKISTTQMVRGTVVSTDAGKGTLVLQQDATPGGMRAMEMTYPLADHSVANDLHRGDRILATLDEYKGTTEVSGISVLAEAMPDFKPKVQYHVPAPGDTVPNFRMLDQSDKMVDLKQYRGKVLVMTFVYTHCPLANFCPRMSRNFAKIDKELQANSKLYDDTHLLSVSFDPARDTPKVLRSYGEAYTGRYTQETFAHWTFAAPPEKELPKVLQYFDLGVTPGADGLLQHSLATLVIGRDGKVTAFWPTNDWTVSEVLAKVKTAAAVS